MEDVDEFIQKLKEEQEMKDYLKNGIYPDRLKSKHTIIHVPTLPPDIFPSIPHPSNDHNPHLEKSLQYLMNRLNSVEIEIKDVMTREIKDGMTREIKENECPICMEDMGINNYLIPSCNHKVCIPCFINNLKQNNQMCNRCCLCREKIIQ